MWFSIVTFILGLLFGFAAGAGCNSDDDDWDVYP